MDAPDNLSPYMTQGFDHAQIGDFGWLVENSDEWTPAYVGEDRALIFRKGTDLIRVTVVAVLGETVTDDGEEAVDCVMAGEGKVTETPEDAAQIVNEARMDYMLRRYEDEGRFNSASMN